MSFPFGYRAKHGTRYTRELDRAKVFNNFEDAEKQIKPEERVVEYDALGLEDDD